MKHKMKTGWIAGSFLVLGFLYTPLPVMAAEDNQQNYEQTMDTLRDKNTEVLEEVMKGQMTDQQGSDAENSQIQQLLMMREQQNHEEEKKKKYSYKGYAGKRGLEGVRMPPRLFNNIPNSR
jgi:hypothetical protein